MSPRVGGLSPSVLPLRECLSWLALYADGIAWLIPYFVSRVGRFFCGPKCRASGGDFANGLCTFTRMMNVDEEWRTLDMMARSDKNGC